MDLNCRMQRHTGLTQTERHLRDYILQNPERMARMNVRELAQASFTSPSAVIRFCQKFGYKGLKDFKADLLCGSEEQSAGELPDSNYPFGADTPFAAVTDAVLRLEQESLRRLRTSLDSGEVERAVNMLLRADCVDLCAIGTSGHMSEDFAFRMMKFGRRVNIVSARMELSYASQQMDSRHCLLIVSYSGSNEQVRLSLRTAREQGGAGDRGDRPARQFRGHAGRLRAGPAAPGIQRRQDLHLCLRRGGKGGAGCVVRPHFPAELRRECGLCPQRRPAPGKGAGPAVKKL